MPKPKVATDWLAACAGCHMSLLDIDEKLVDLLKKVELTASPITDLKVPPESGVDVGILSGSINSTGNVEVAEQMRRRCKILVAIGDCAVFGGITTMRNFCPLQESLKRAYEETESTVDGQIPNWPDIMKPVRARAVDEVVKVDVYLPGCPPRPEALFHVLNELAEGRIPQLSKEMLTYD